jgi:hypothetical protein
LRVSFSLTPARTVVVWQDESVANGAFLLDLLTAVEPRAVNPELVTPGSTPEEAALNAKYVLSVARKLGCLGGFPPSCACSVGRGGLLSPKPVASLLHR